MGFIGREALYGVFEKQILTPDGVANSYSLNFKVGLSTSILVAYSATGFIAGTGLTVLEPGTGKDYTITPGGERIVFSFVPALHSELYVLFLGKQLLVPRTSGLEPAHDVQTATGAQNYTLSKGPLDEASLIVFDNGVLKLSTTDWTISGSTVHFLVAPTVGHRLDFYIHGVERSDSVIIPDGSVTTLKLADRSVTPEKINLNWTNFTPTFQTFGGMIIDTYTLLSAEYINLLGVIKVRVHAQIQLSGTPDNKIRISIPINNNGSTNIGGTVNLSTPTLLEIGPLKWGGVSKIDAYRELGVNYFTSSPDNVWTLEINAEYRAV